MKSRLAISHWKRCSGGASFYSVTHNATIFNFTVKVSVETSAFFSVHFTRDANWKNGLNSICVTSNIWIEQGQTICRNMSVIFNIIVLYPNLILAFLHPKPFGNLSLWFKFDGDLYWTSLPVVKDLSRLFPYLKTSQRNSSSRSRLSLVDKSVLQHCQQEVKYSRLRA